MCIEIWPTMPEWVCLSRMAWPYNNVRWPPPCEDLEKGGKTWIYTIQEMHKHLYTSLLLHFKLQQDQFFWHTTKPKINTTLRWVKTRTLWQCLASQWQGGYNRNTVIRIIKFKKTFRGTKKNLPIYPNRLPIAGKREEQRRRTRDSHPELRKTMWKRFQVINMYTFMENPHAVSNLK